MQEATEDTESTENEQLVEKDCIKDLSPICAYLNPRKKSLCSL
jgi:hypothetical protein